MSTPNGNMSANTTQAAGKRDTLLWISLLVFGIVGIAVGKFIKPAPIAEAYVAVTTHARVLAEEVPPASQENGAAAETPVKRVWVESDDPQLRAGTLRKVEGVEPVVWDERSKMAAKNARDAMAAAEVKAEELSRPIDPTGLSKEEFEKRESARLAGLAELEKTRIVASPRDSFGIWFAALLTLGILSFLVRDNPFYKVAESILIGVSAAYWMLVAYWSTLVPDLFAKLAPDMVRATMLPSLQVSEHPTKDFLFALLPLSLALMLLWRLAPRGGWIGVWPLAVVIGTFAGMRLTAAIEADFMAQIAATMQPVVVLKSDVVGGNASASFDLGGTLLAIFGVVGVVTVLVYFFFSLEHKGVIGKTARVGVWYLMITFGAAFGLTVMGRITLLAERFSFLFYDWLGLG
jgi:hypothetical protein